MNRLSGILMPISSLPGDYGIGSLGDGAFHFIDFLNKSGFHIWQVLPFNHPDEYFSPYKSVSSFACNPFYIDLPTLYKKGLISKEELDNEYCPNPYTCAFEKLTLTRIPLLIEASKRVKNKSVVWAFLKKYPELSLYARFMALKELNGDLPFIEWKSDVDEQIVFAYGFMQYEFYLQWKKVRKYAKEHGVQIIGDLPFYVSYDSADVFFHPNQFDLDDSLHMRNVSGVPPDYFSSDGQLWGNPLYNWSQMEQDGFSFWKERLKYQFELFDGIRIDHFRGIESFWSVPNTAKTAKEGKWVKGPGKKLIQVIKKMSRNKLIIAEDLGDITKEVSDLISYSGFPGMRVLQFAFLGDPNTPHLPYRYIENCVAYTGTHDNNTLLGYIWEQSDDNRKRILDYFQFKGDDWDHCYDQILCSMLSSVARLVIFPVQDLFHFGSDCRFNTPGVAGGNWAYRITREQLDSLDHCKFAYYNSLYGRQ